MFIKLLARLGRMPALLLIGVISGCAPSGSSASPSASATASGPARAIVGVGQRPAIAAVGAGAVWVPNTGDGTVTKIDPATNRVVATISIGNQLAFYHGECEGKGSVHSFMVTSFHVRRCDLPSAVATATAAPITVSNTFKVKHVMYVTFEVHTINHSTGGICLLWYINTKMFTSFAFPVSSSTSA